jgi:hypothetical protein
MIKITDKELLDAAEKGLLSKPVQKRAIHVFYCSILPTSPTIKDAVITTANKFGISENTVRNVVANKY